jgi:hypothetical protein
MTDARRRSATRCVTAMAGVLVATLAGCSSTDDSASPSPSSASSGEAATDASDPTTSSQPVGKLPRTELQTTIVPVRGGGGPDWMAVGFGSLWVKRDNNVVARISPDGRVLATIEAEDFEQPVCQGLGVSDNAIWACANGGRIMRIDPQTNQVDAVVDIAKVNEQGRLTSYDGHVWMLTGDGDRLVGLSDRDNQPGRSIDLGAFCTDVSDTVNGSTLWVVCPYDNKLLRVDLAGGEVVGEVRGLRGATAVSARGSGVWVCVGKGVTHVDATTMTALGTQPLPAGFSCSLRAYDDAVWVRSGDRNSPFAARIDPDTGALVQVITTEGRISGGDVIEFADALWVSSFEEGAVYKLRMPQV